MKETSDQSFPCTECQAGHMHRGFFTYFTWIGDDLITVPDFPSWVCDVCGRREYDLHALNQLNLLLNPNAGRPSPRQRNVNLPTDNKTPRPTRSE